MCIRDRVRAVNVKGHGNFTRSAIEELTEKALKLGAKGMAWIALKDDGEPYSILTKYFSQEEFQSLLDAVDGKPGDFILFCADQFSTVCRTLGGLRLELADMLGLRKPGDYRFLIVTDFPEFEYSQEEDVYKRQSYGMIVGDRLSPDLPCMPGHSQIVRTVSGEQGCRRLLAGESISYSYTLLLSRQEPRQGYRSAVRYLWKRYRCV